MLRSADGTGVRDSTKKREGDPKDRLWQPHDFTPTLPRATGSSQSQVILYMTQQSLGSG